MKILLNKRKRSRLDGVGENNDDDMDTKSNNNDTVEAQEDTTMNQQLKTDEEKSTK